MKKVLWLAALVISLALLNHGSRVDEQTIPKSGNGIVLVVNSTIVQAEDVPDNEEDVQPPQDCCYVCPLIILYLQGGEARRRGRKKAVYEIPHTAPRLPNNHSEVIELLLSENEERKERVK